MARERVSAALHGARPDVIILAPVRAHAAMDADDQCPRHDKLVALPGFERQQVIERDLPRSWRMVEAVTLGLLDAGPGRLVRLVSPIALDAGTPLRLDALVGALYCDGQIHETTDDRFCIVGGSSRGMCLKANDTLLDDHVTHSGDVDAIMTDEGVLLGQLSDWMAARWVQD